MVTSGLVKPTRLPLRTLFCEAGVPLSLLVREIQYSQFLRSPGLGQTPVLALKLSWFSFHTKSYVFQDVPGEDSSVYPLVIPTSTPWVASQKYSVRGPISLENLIYWRLDVLTVVRQEGVKPKDEDFCLLLRLLSASHSPHVDGGGVLRGSQQHVWGPVPEGHHLIGVGLCRH